MQMTQGERLKALREKKGLLAKQVAAQAGVSRQLITNLETDYQMLTSDKAVILAKFYGVTTDYLLCVSDEPKGA